jgi:hypothetical protein
LKNSGLKSCIEIQGSKCFLKSIQKKIDNHAFRAEYARARYEELLELKREQEEEILRNYRGYDLECLRQLLQDLGHNRVSVVVEHYLR